METTFEWTGSVDHPLANILQQAFDTIDNNSTLDDHILKMHGASGIKYRKFINNLVALVPNARYLEIGSYVGSTVCNAVYKNNVQATCIDNWQWNNKDGLMKNLEMVKSDSTTVSVIESDFRQVNYNQIGKFNVYMYDGPHAERDQYDGITYVQNALDDVFVLIVDDYNDPVVRRGTINAISAINLEVIRSLIVTTPPNGPHNENSDWHFGYYIAVLKKKA